jgi:exodeoxyribonuclease VII large subunit
MARGLTARAELGGQRLDRTADRLGAGVAARLGRGRARLDALDAALRALSPMRVLARGFALARDEDGRLLRRTGQFAAGARFRLTVADGDVPARVEKR